MYLPLGRHDKADDLVVSMEQFGLLHTQDGKLSREIQKMRGDVKEILEVHCVQQADGTLPRKAYQLGLVSSETRQQLLDDDC